MPEIDLWKVFVSLGIPGLALGIFYMLFRQFRFNFPEIPRSWIGPIVVLFMLLSTAVVFYSLSLWGPYSNNSGNNGVNNSKVQTVLIHPNQGDFLRGFFTGREYIVTMTTPRLLESLKSEDDIRITWNSNGQDYKGIARVVKTAPQAILMKFLDGNWPKHAVSVRSAKSLEIGDRVAKYIDSNYKEYGAVVKVDVMEKTFGWNTPIVVQRALITTSISSSGDGGAPVIDENNKVVGMIYAGDNSKTISIPIEDI
jgi:hypothetical protein